MQCNVQFFLAHVRGHLCFFLGSQCLVFVRPFGRRPLPLPGDACVVEALAPGLRHEDAAIRCTAADMLGAQGSAQWGCPEWGVQSTRLSSLPRS